jgi:hypothetical protein
MKGRSVLFDRVLPHRSSGVRPLMTLLGVWICHPVPYPCSISDEADFIGQYFRVCDGMEWNTSGPIT